MADAADEKQEVDEMAEFDVIVLGTGLKECILSGLISSTAGKKLLHLDRNSYYGGESASLNLDQMFKKFRGAEEAPKAFGRAFDYNVDLTPKFLMACGTLIQILVKTKVNEYLEFTSIGGSYVLHGKKVHKVPASTKEALASGMLGLMEKNRFRQFLSYVAKYDKDEPKTHEKLDLSTMTAAELYKYFKLTDNAIGFTGHAIALYVDDSYLTRPAIELVMRSQLYAWSVQRYGTSPYLYPKYGLGGMPEGFSRRAAVYGGTFMLNMSSADPFVQQIHFDDDGKVTGITLGPQVVAAYDLKTAYIKTKQLVADPTYFIGTPKVEKAGEIARCIAILDHPIPDTNEADSCQLILPANQTGRKSDIYVCMTSDKQHVAAKGKYVAVISGNVEGANNDPNVQLAPALDLLGKVLEKFTWVSEVYRPTDDGQASQCFITSSMDATTHFQTSTLEVLDLYERITGKKVDLTPDPAGAGDEAKAEPEPEPDVGEE